MKTASNSRVWGTILLTITIFSLCFPAYAKYGGGSGEPNDPYQIATPEHLILLGENPEDYDKHFILTADIDLDPDLPGRKMFDRAVIAPDRNDDVEDWFEGTPFAGVFDGNGHRISHLTITGTSYLGLFGKLGSGASISNLGLEAVDVNGIGELVGGLVGYNDGGSLSTSYNTGTVSYNTGSVGGGFSVGGLVGVNRGSITSSYSAAMVNGTGGNNVGGLVGVNGGSITNSSSTSSVSGGDDVGGLVGLNEGSITNSYNTGTVNGNRSVGGLVGSNGSISGWGSITSSYSTGAVSGDTRVGGLVGLNFGSITITSSYSTGSVTGNEGVGGLVGGNMFDIVGAETSCFWDIRTSGQATSAGGTGKTTAEMQDINTYLSAGWDFADEILNGTCHYWQISPGEYPRLRYQDGENLQMPEGFGTAEQPYLIRDAANLGTVWFKPMAHYRLETSLDLSGIMWSMAVVPWFEGTFDGNGHVISNLHMQGSKYLGLFGQIGPEAKISNLGLEAVDVKGSGGDIAGLVGYNRGSITSCYSMGTVNGTGYGVGGLVGRNYGNVTSSRSTGMVSGDEAVGGLVGGNYGYGNIISSYSTGTVSGDRAVGGLVGDGYGNISSSYSTGLVSGDTRVGGLVGFTTSGSITMSLWDMEASGQATSAGGVGLTTAEMINPYMLGLNGLANDPNWVLDAGRDYPRLAWEGTAGQIIPEPIIDWLDGQGIKEEPYRVDTADQLIILSRAGGLWDKHFILGADIDLDPNLPGRQVFSQAVIQVFSGVFDGNGHVISHLTILGDSYLGLFGQLGPGATISNLALELVNVNGTGHYVGGLVGNNDDGSVTSSYSTGSVSGGNSVGGLVGYNWKGDIATSYSAGTVNGNNSVGGLVGSNGERVTITFSYSTGSVRGGNSVGGLVGFNRGSITMCYSTGSVSGSSRVGGLVGYNCGSLTMSYSTGTVGGDEDIGGLVGYFNDRHPYSEDTINSFWDIETSGQTTSNGGIGKTTAEMQTANTFLEAGWDFIDEIENGIDNIWWIYEGNDYPKLWWELIPGN